MRPVGRQRAYQQEHRVADWVMPGMRRAIESALRRGSAAFPMEATAQLLQHGNIARLVEQIPWESVRDAMTGEVERLLRTALIMAARQQGIPGLVVKLAEFRFDVTNPRALEWVLRHAGELVRQITDETRAAISRIIQRMFEDGVPVDQAARELRQIVGLHERYALAVDNYRRGLVAQEMEPDLLEERIAAYADRLRRNRALVIARTESIKASAMGQQELWRQARDTGLLDAERVEREWLTTPDERLCPICEPMDGQLVGLEDYFTAGDGSIVLTPPVHPQCRCAVRLHFAPLAPETASP